MCDMTHYEARPEDFAHAAKYQALCLKTAVYPRDPTPAALLSRAGIDMVALSYVGLGTAGEAGEFADKVKKVMRDHKTWTIGMFEQKRQDMMAELGDVLWYVAMAAQELGTSLPVLMANNINKLHDRQQRNALQGAGDHR